MILLFEKTERLFNHNGFGNLKDALTCTVKEQLNGDYTLELSYPINGVHYEDIQLERIIYCKANDYQERQAFRIYEISKPINGVVSISAEHISYDMSGYPVKGAIEHYAWYVQEVFDHIDNNSVIKSPFIFGSDITEEKKHINLSQPRSIRSFLGTDNNALLSVFGGEWEFDMYKAYLHKQRGQNRSVVIEYGKNLLDLTQEEKCSEMYTDVYPYYYKDDDGLQYLDNDLVNIIHSDYKKILTLDLTQEFEEMPTQDELRKKTQEYIEKNKLGEPKVSLKVSFIKNPEVIHSLHDVQLGDTVKVKFVKLGVNSESRCISYEFNVLTEQYDSIEMGEPEETIVDTVIKTQNDVNDTNTLLDNEIDRAMEEEERLEDDILGEISRATGEETILSSRITKTEEDILLEVSRAVGAENSFSSSLKLTADAIVAEVQRATTAEGSLSSSIQMTADSISAKVDKNGIISAINMSSESIDIDSSKINMTGYVTITDLGSTGSTNIDGSRITTGTIDSNRVNVHRLCDRYGGTAWVDEDMYGYANCAVGTWTFREAFQFDKLSHGSTDMAFLRVASGANGGLVYYTTGASTSAKKYKHDISPVIDYSLNPYKILNIPIVQFGYNIDAPAEDEHIQKQDMVIGMIADDVEKYYPVAAQHNQYGEVKNWDERYIIPPMLYIMKQQQEELERMRMSEMQLLGELSLIKQKMEVADNAKIDKQTDNS